MPAVRPVHRPLRPLQLVLDVEPTSSVRLPPALRVVDDLAFGPVPTPRSALPPLTSWTARLAVGIGEVLSGVRPASQLSRWLSHPAQAGLQRRAIAAAHSRSQHAARSTTPTVRSLRITEPADGVAEVAAVISTATRPLVLALRIEGLDGRWICTQIGTPDGWQVGGDDDCVTTCPLPQLAA